MATKKKLTIDQMLQGIAELTVLELSELVGAIEDKFNVSATPVTQTVTVEAETEKEVEQTQFEVFLHDFGAKKILVIKALRGLTDLSLMDSKNAIDAGGVLAENLSKADAEQFAKTLSDQGANVEVK